MELGQTEGPSADPEYADLVFIEEKEKKPPSRGFFSSIFKSFMAPKKRKTTKITLACDTDMKRRQWMLTVNYFITQYLRNHSKTRVAAGRDNTLQTHEDV